MLRLRQLLRFAAARDKAHLLALGDLLDNQRARFALNFARQDRIAHLGVLQRHAEITVIQHRDTVRIHAALQQAGGGRDAVRLAPQGHGRGQAVETDIHNRAVREGRVKGVRVLAIEIALVARRVLAVVDKRFAHFAHLRQGLLQQQEVRQAGGFERFEQHHLVFAGKRDGRFHFFDVRRQRLLANHMLFMAEEQLRLREVQGVRAGDIDRVNGVALRHVIKRGE